MKNTILIILFSCFYLFSYSQNDASANALNRKGSFYIYWGYNWSDYTKSNIHFSGENYDFTLDKVVAHDRPTPFDASIYFNPKWLTIPQYNLRIGYFLSNNYNISIAIDHMKYVMVGNQTVKINGNISQTGTIYDGTYSNSDIVLSQDFLKFEHTDGLNYANVELRRFDEIYAYKNLRINLSEGFGAGPLIPRTNVTLLNNPRYDEFHLAGYGFGGVVALNLEFYKHFFIQSELKGGFIHMPDIRTTMNEADKASQHFFYYQVNVVIGGRFNLNFSKKEASTD